MTEDQASQPDVAPARTTEDIEKEYNSLCGPAGDAQFKIKLIESDLFKMNQRMADLVNEKIALQQMKAKAMAEAEKAAQ